MGRVHTAGRRPLCPSHANPWSSWQPAQRGTPATPRQRSPRGPPAASPRAVHAPGDCGASTSPRPQCPSGRQPPRLHPSPHFTAAHSPTALRPPVPSYRPPGKSPPRLPHRMSPALAHPRRWAPPPCPPCFPQPAWVFRLARCEARQPSAGGPLLAPLPPGKPRAGPNAPLVPPAHTYFATLRRATRPTNQ